ncbi:MAG: alanine dehydrogenase [Betaproteobacteria bacterium]|nr:alanine dehydrogenase [Betaproteobacteria bacterium]
MKIGVPKEIKTDEYRVGMTPTSVREAVEHGHEVSVETGAVLRAGITADAYRAAGARIAESAEEVYQPAELVVKVKEPQPRECALLHAGQVLFTYLHLAADPKQAKLLLESGCTAIAYETITDDRGGLPLLAPMSEVAGRMSIQVGAAALEREHGGRGVLLGGVPGTPRAKVVIFGGGVVGSNAARIAVGMGADVTVFDKSMSRLQYLDDIFGAAISTQFATIGAAEEALIDADLVIGAVLIPGAVTPRIVTRRSLSRMKKGAVLVDVSIDQGGCFETSHPTTHSKPTYIVDGIVHYCVANMPGAVPRTSTHALNNATLPFVLALAEKGWERACKDDRHLAAGLNVQAGRITHPAVAKALPSLA